MIKVVYYSFFPGGGIGRYAHEMISSVARRPDVKAELACSDNFEWRNAASYDVWPGLLTVNHRTPLFRKARFLGAQFVSPARLCRRVRETGAQIVHFNNINHLTLPWWKGRLLSTGARMFITAHDVRRAKAILCRPWEERQLRAAYRAMSGIFVHSGHQREDLIDFAGVKPERIHEVPFGALPYGEPIEDQTATRKKLGLPIDRRIALLFGNIRDDKNIDGFLRAMASLEERPFILIVGRAGGIGNKGDDHYRRLIVELGLRDDVHFCNEYIPDDRVAEYFAAADWIALPYRTSFTSQSAALSVAAYYRRPVLCSNAPTLAATVRASRIGVVADSDRVDDLAEAVRELGRMIDAGTTFDFDDFEERHSWKENARITVDAYRAALDRSPSRV